MKRLPILGLAILGLCAAANAQINVSGGIYSAKDSTVRDVFGTNAFSWGVGLGRASRDNRAGAGFDIAGLSLNAPANRFFMLGGTYGWEVQNGNTPGSNFMTYARAGAGLAYYDYDLNNVATIANGHSIQPLTAFEAGLVFNRQFTLSAQYLLMPDAGNLSMNGFRIQAMFSLTK